MRRRVQSPAGFHLSKKMSRFSLWFIIFGIIRETNCASSNIESTNASENSSGNPIGKPLKNQSTSIESPAASSEYQNGASLKVQRAVPARIKTLQLEDDDYREFLHDEALGHVRKVPLYLLKMYFYNKSQLDRRQGRPHIYEDPSKNPLLQNTGSPFENQIKRNTVIPAPRFGRQDVNDEDKDSSENSNRRPLLSDVNENKKRDEPSKSVIPYPRLGRDYEDMADEIDRDPTVSSDGWWAQDTAHSNTRVKRETADYVLPQIRYGRSMILLPTTKSDESSKEKPANFVLPYPRPGRKSGFSNVLLPYPRSGRSSNSYPYKEFGDYPDEKKRQSYMIPSARLGRSPANVRFDADGVSYADDRFLGLKVNPLLLKNSYDKSKNGDNNSNFVIPYPRPGKKSVSKMLDSSKFMLKSKTGENTNFADYVLPYPRPGKKSYKMNQREKSSRDNYSDNDLEKFILPYPRPGRSMVERLEAEVSDFDESSDEESFGDESSEVRADDQKYSSTDPDYNYYVYDSGMYLFSNDGSDFSLSRSKRSNSVLTYPRTGPSNSVVAYPSIGRSKSVIQHTKSGRSVSVVPYPRLGRSDAIVPYPRLGRSNAVVPYPRPGRSNAVVPYPRPGRSNAVVPYPRPGRSNAVVPYPRPGRSNAVVPYPRPGRSNAIVPYPRPGRSNAVVPYPRPGRSNAVVPYPRPGKSTVSSDNDKPLKFIVKSDRLNSNFLLPNIRPGRSQADNYVVPYPRPGRSSNDGKGYVLPHPRIGRSEDSPGENETTYGNTVIPYPRLGRSEKLVAPVPESLNTVHRLNKHMLSHVDDSVYILPYPRPGRSSD